MSGAKAAQQAQRLLQQLEDCPCEQHLAAATDALRESAGGKGWGGALSALAAAPRRELQAAGAGAFDAVLALCGAAFGISRAAAVSEEHVLALYSFVKRLVGLGCLRAALAHGWALLADLDAARGGAKQPSRVLQDVDVAACLNVVICSCEPAEPVLGSLDRLAATADRLLAALRAQPAAGAAEQAGVLAKCLLKIALKLGAEASAARDAGGDGVWEGARQLQLHLLAALQLSGRPQALHQVAAKACAALPPRLRSCSLVALLQAAGVLPGSAQDAQRAVLPAAAAAPCLQQLLALAERDGASAAGCVTSLLQLQQQGCRLPHGVGLLLLWLHAKSAPAAAEAGVLSAARCCATEAGAGSAEPDAAALQLQLGATVLEQLLASDACVPLLPACASLAVGLAAAAAAAAPDGANESSLQLAAQATAAAAACLARTAFDGGGTLALWQQLHAAVEKLVGWQGLLQAVQSGQDSAWACGLPAADLDALGRQLSVAAQDCSSSDGSGDAASSSSSAGGSCCPGGAALAAGLWLSAAQCGCTAAMQQQDEEQAPAAVALALRLARAHVKGLQQQQQQQLPAALQQPVRDVVQVAASLMLRLDARGWQQQASGAQRLLAHVSQLRCGLLAAAAGDAPGEVSAVSEASSSSSSSSAAARQPPQGRSRRQAAGSAQSKAVRAAAAENRVPAALPAAWELAAACRGSQSNGRAAGLARLYCLEGACLLQLAGGRGQQLLAQLLAAPCPGDATAQAHHGLARGVLLLQCAGQQQPAGGAQDAVDALAAARERFAALLQLPAQPGVVGGSSGQASSKPRGKRGKAAGSSKAAAAAAGGSAGFCVDDAARAALDGWGAADAEQLAAAAAAAQCWLAVARARLALQAPLEQRAAECTGESSARAASGRQPDADEDGGSEQESDGGEELAWAAVLDELLSSCQAFELWQAAAAGGSSCCWFGDEAAAAAVQAWHIAALQGWLNVQQRLRGALTFLAPGASREAVQQVAQLQALTDAAGDGSWLAWLVAPQPRVGGGGTCAEPDSSSSSSRGKRGGKQAAGAGSRDWQCLCQLQERARCLDDARAGAGVDQQQAPADALSQQLLHAQAQLAAGRAALCCGDASRAATLTEAAVQAVRDVLDALPGGSAAGGSGRRRGDAPSAAAHFWPAVGLYMAGLLLLSELHEGAGCPEDALRLLKEAARLAASARCCHIAALAHAGASCVHSRMGQPAKAAPAAAAAASWLARAERQQQQAGGGGGGGGALLHAFVAAAVHRAQAAQAWAAQDLQAAQRAAQAGVNTLDAALQQQLLQPGSLLAWRAVEARAQLQLWLSHCCLQGGQHPDAAAASELLREALALLRDDAPACGACRSTAWPCAEAALALQLLALSAPPLPDAGAASCGLALAGFGSSAHSNDLLAEFMDAAASQARPDAAGGKVAARAGRRGGAGAGSKAGGTKAASRAAAAGAGAAAQQTPAQWLCAVLQLLPATAQQPLVLQEACGMARRVCQAHGAVHAAAMFLQASLGAPVGQQQLMLAASKAAAQQEPGSAALWRQLQEQLSMHDVLAEAADAAAVAAASGDGASSGGRGAEATLWRELERVSRRWLRAALGRLPARTAACSITTDTAAGGATLIGAAAPPVGAAAAAGGEPRSLTICRLQQACDGSDAAASPLLVTLPTPSMPPRSGSATADVLQEQRSILADASASMAAGAGASSAADKAAWWQQRVKLDQRMAALLQHLDGQWLGPWRCLLMQPGQRAADAAAAAAAADFVAEFFDCVLDDAPRQLLSQLVALLLLHRQACSVAELQQALLSLSQLAGQRVDGQIIDRLMAGLTSAQAAVGRAATPAAAARAPSTSKLAAGRTPGTAAKQPRPSASSGGTQRAAPADSGASCSTAAPPGLLPGPQPAAPVAATPAVKMRRIRFAEPAGGDTQDTASTLAAPRTVQKAGRPGRVGAAATDQPQAPPLPAPSVVVPPSIARHAARRSRLQSMASSSSGGGGGCATPATSSKAARSQAACRAMLREVAEAVEAQDASDEDGGGSSSSSSSSSPARQQRQQPAASADAEAACAQPDESSGQPPAVLLLLDGGSQQLPWESCPGLQRQRAYRCPSLAVAAAAALRARAAAAAAGRRAGLLQLASSFYLLNPDGDLAATQATFEAHLQRMKLEGVAGAAPGPRALTRALQSRDLFLYFGHGGGEQYVPLAALKRLPRCAGALLMGCSSGRLRASGLYGGGGPIWGYLSAGCPGAVANLWDVTDRDIDRFAEAVLARWTGSDDGGDAPPAGAGVGMAAAVAASRRACRLPHLIGAAAVCYGLPTAVAAGGREVGG